MPHPKRTFSALACSATLLVFAVGAPAGAISGTTRIVSVGTSGGSNDVSGAPSVSADGRFVAFASKATNLVSAPTGGHWQIYLKDFFDGSITLVSTDANGNPGNDDSTHPSLTKGADAVAFESKATDLTTDATNGVRQIFAKDLNQDALPDGTKPGLIGMASISDDGAAGTLDSVDPSYDGNILFTTGSPNLLPAGPGQDLNNKLDVYATQMFFITDPSPTIFHRTNRVSVSSACEESNGDSWGGVGSDFDGARYVAFTSTATNLAPQPTGGIANVFLHDRDPNHFGTYDYCDETYSTSTKLVTAGSSGVAANDVSFDPALSRDGHFLTFVSKATNLPLSNPRGATIPVVDHHANVFFEDLIQSVTQLISVSSGGDSGGNADSFAPAISELTVGEVVQHASDGLDEAGVSRRLPDAVPPSQTKDDIQSDLYYPGGYVDFAVCRALVDPTESSRMFPAPLDAVVQTVIDTITGLNLPVTRPRPPAPADDPCSLVSANVLAISVAFSSDATNLLSTPDANPRRDVYVRDLAGQNTDLISVDSTGVQPAGPGAGDAGRPSISTDGRYVGFEVTAPNWPQPAGNELVQQVWEHDRGKCNTGTQQNELVRLIAPFLPQGGEQALRDADCTSIDH